MTGMLKNGVEPQLIVDMNELSHTEVEKNKTAIGTCISWKSGIR
ncbi:hypothetical protein B4096_1865 [Heyndrickxia coagulans]|nr:hypothetical protein B4096_1865 [Heyndrickxia coagulans]